MWGLLRDLEAVEIVEVLAYDFVELSMDPAGSGRCRRRRSSIAPRHSNDLCDGPLDLPDM
ncbi:MAG: hypothetical protein ACRDYA_14600 [Egibacteraceae bacterium]